MNTPMKKLPIHYHIITKIFKVYILRNYMDPDDLKIIQQQVPDIPIHQIEQVYQSCQQDVFETI